MQSLCSFPVSLEDQRQPEPRRRGRKLIEEAVDILVRKWMSAEPAPLIANQTVSTPSVALESAHEQRKLAAAEKQRSSYALSICGKGS
jgi:hypothetical protein